jgi:CRP/FNR family transcriptional regulator, cyclic AMP receptor protein
LFAGEQSRKFHMPETAAAHRTVSRLGWLSSEPERFRQLVLERTVFQKVGAEQVIYAAGDSPGGVFGLVSGGLRILVAPDETAAFSIHLFVPGSWTGEAAAITGRLRLVTVATTRDTQLLHLPLAAVNAILREDSEAFRSFARLTHWHLATALGVIDDLMLRDPHKRVVAALLRLSGCRSEIPEGLGPVDLDLSQDDLALMSNVGRTLANEVLRELQAVGQIEVGYRRIRVVAPDGLRPMLSK